MKKIQIKRLFAHVGDRLDGLDMKAEAIGNTVSAALDRGKVATETLASHGRQIAALDEHVAELVAASGGGEAHNRRHDAVAKLVDNHARELTKIDGLFGRLAEDLARRDERADAMAAISQKHTDAITELAEQVNQLDGHTATQIVGLSDRVRALETAAPADHALLHEDHESRMRALERRAREDTEPAEVPDRRLGQRVANLGRLVREYGDRLRALEAHLALVARVDELVRARGESADAGASEPPADTPTLLAVAQEYVSSGYMGGLQRLRDAVNAEPARVAEREAAVRALVETWTSYMHGATCTCEVCPLIARVEATS